MDYDIIIVGAGLVGTSLAIALRGLGCRIGILETHFLDPAIKSRDDVSSRPLSLTYNSQMILQTLGVWAELAPFAAPITTVHVSEHHRLGSITFTAAQEKVPALGYVVNADRLQSILYQQAARQLDVKFVSIQSLSAINSQPSEIALTIQTIDGEKTLKTKLLMGADGTHSTTRRLLNINALEENSGETALTATLQLSQAHKHCAYERFTKQGILAVLPLQDSHRCQLVWTLDSTLAEKISHQDNAVLAKMIQENFGDWLGDVHVIERGKQYPLQLMCVEQPIVSRAVLMGNAAHTLYPLAAQGFNLGLRDVAAIAEILKNAQDLQQDLGDWQILESYWQRRRRDQCWARQMTTRVSQIFAIQIPFLATLRSAGLLAVDLIPPIKHKLAQQFMGLSV